MGDGGAAPDAVVDCAPGGGVEWREDGVCHFGGGAVDVGVVWCDVCVKEEKSEVACVDGLKRNKELR